VGLNSKNRENFEFLVKIFPLKEQIPLSDFFWKLGAGEGVPGP